MSKLKKERLNQMIANALSYKQESSRFNSDFSYKRLKDFVLKPKVYGLTFASLIIAYVFIPPILSSRNLVNINQINDYMTLSIIDDFWIKKRVSDAPLFTALIKINFSYRVINSTHKRLTTSEIMERIKVLRIKINIM